MKFCLKTVGAARGVSSFCSPNLFLFAGEVVWCPSGIFVPNTGSGNFLLTHFQLTIEEMNKLMLKTQCQLHFTTTRIPNLICYMHSNQIEKMSRSSIFRLRLQVSHSLCVRSPIPAHMIYGCMGHS